MVVGTFGKGWDFSCRSVSKEDEAHLILHTEHCKSTGSTDMSISPLKKLGNFEPRHPHPQRDENLTPVARTKI